jgi:hypothetical protein
VSFPEIFERRRKFNVIVPRSRSKLLNEYIQEALDEMKEWLLKGWISKVAIVILQPMLATSLSNTAPAQQQQPQPHIVVERFFIELNSLVQSNEDEPIHVRREQQSPKSLFELQNILRSFLLMFGSSNSLLPNSANRSGCTFRLLAYTKATAEVLRSPLWVVQSDVFPAEPQASTVVIPLKSDDAVFFKLQAYIEQLDSSNNNDVASHTLSKNGARVSSIGGAAASSSSRNAVESDDDFRAPSPKYNEMLQ